MVTICIFHKSVYISTSKPNTMDFPTKLLELLFCLLSYCNSSKCRYKHCMLLSVQDILDIPKFQHKIYQWLTLTFKFKFSLFNSHAVTMLLLKLATHFLLLNTFLSYSFSSIKLFITSFPPGQPELTVSMKPPTSSKTIPLPPTNYFFPSSNTTCVFRKVMYR